MIGHQQNAIVPRPRSGEEKPGQVGLCEKNLDVSSALGQYTFSFRQGCRLASYCRAVPRDSRG